MHTLCSILHSDTSLIEVWEKNNADQLQEYTVYKKYAERSKAKKIFHSKIVFLELNLGKILKK